MNLIQMTDILLAHLQVELAKESTEEQLCSFTKQPGDSVALDYAECGGMAWVRHVTSSPSINGYTNDVTPDSCFWGMAHTVEMGVMRKAPIPEQVLNTIDLPDDAELSAAADRLMADMAAMNRAIQGARGEFDLLAGTYTPVGPVGGTVGGTWSMVLGEE